VTTRAELRADCAGCAALCCVAPAFARSADFAIDKPAGVRCLHLADDHRCSIHERLRPAGFPGCAAYDCFGAGQRLVRQTDEGPATGTAELMAALPVLRGLHELLWYLGDALSLTPPDPVRRQLTAAAAEVEAMAAGSAAALAGLDVGPLRAAVAPLLRETSRLARSGLGGDDLAEQDLAGRDLGGAGMAGACLRGAVLLGADLRLADLSRADLLGADLRGADLRGARLDGAFYLTRTQVGSALGDKWTTLLTGLEHPAHWSG
jgi:hypothetical protein